MKKNIIIILCIFIALCIDSIVIAESNIYGSIRFGTFYMSEKDRPDHRDTNHTVWVLMDDSRIGGTIDNSPLNIKGGFEFGNGQDGPEIRKLYGIYKISEHTSIEIGKDYTPLNYFPSNQVAPIYENRGDSGLKPYGGIYEGFKNMIQFSTDRGKIALIQPADLDDTKLKLGLDADIERTAPKIEVSYNFGNKSLYLDLYSGFQTYKLTENTTNTKFNINSWILGINFGADFDQVYIAGNAYSGQNVFPYGLWAEGDDSPRIIGDKIYDCTTDGYIMAVGIKLNKANVEAGAGYIVHDLDGAVEKDGTLSCYLNVQYHVNDMFYVVPEVGIVNYMEDNAGNDEGKKVYGGIKWQMDF